MCVGEWGHDACGSLFPLYFDLRCVLCKFSQVFDKFTHIIYHFLKSGCHELLFCKVLEKCFVQKGVLWWFPVDIIFSWTFVCVNWDNRIKSWVGHETPSYDLHLLSFLSSFPGLDSLQAAKTHSHPLVHSCTALWPLRQAVVFLCSAKVTDPRSQRFVAVGPLPPEILLCSHEAGNQK